MSLRTEHWMPIGLLGAPASFQRAAREYAEEYADMELSALRAERDALRAAIGMAYGYLWCVNNEPGTPHQHPPEKAAYEARKVLRDLLTKDERGRYINTVLPLVRYDARAALKGE